MAKPKKAKKVNSVSSKGDANSARQTQQYAKYAPWFAAILVLVATVRIIATYDVLSRTGDEQAHIACGMEYLDKGTYNYEPQHPPLIMAAVLPYLNGAHSWGFENFYTEGGAVLYRGVNYEQTLERARTGMLPFFWIACLVVYLWCRRYFDPTTALISVAIFSFTPTILAHAGLATTDIGLTALFGSCLLSTCFLLEQPNWRSGVLFGIALGLAICSKFSFIPFYLSSLLAALVGYLALTRPSVRDMITSARPTILPGALGVGVAFLIVWAIYRFSFGTSPLTGALSVPFPELFKGIDQVMRHNDRGHKAFLLGHISQNGFWYYYPVALLFKVPIPLLILIGLGVYLGWKQYPLPTVLLATFSLGILAVGAWSRINIGIRHVLPLFLFFSILAAAGVRTGTRAASPRWLQRATMAMFLWFGVESLWSHPDYLAYFNEFAMGHPENILVDSDLDWGQDIKRAGKRLRELEAPAVAFRPFNSFTEDFTEFPQLTDFDPVHPTPGWNLVSITNWKATRFGKPLDTPLWMDHVEPFERIGQGMFLYRIPVDFGNSAQSR